MKGFLPCALLFIFFFFPISHAFSESSSCQIVMYRLKAEGIKEIRNDFTPGDKIYADFTFLPEVEQTGVGFRWINPLNKKEQAYFEIVRSTMPPEKQTVLCWLQIHPSLSEKIIGSRFFGLWLLEVWVDGRRVATKAFSVGN